jgi:hypothetical protein
MNDFRRDSAGFDCSLVEKGVGGGISESGVSKAPVFRREPVDGLRPPTDLRFGRTKSGEFSADPDWKTFSSEK